MLRATRYFGGKGGTIGKWIVSNFPQHSTYIEPFGGLASVLLNKPRSSKEVYAELNGATFNFMGTVKRNPGLLIRAIEAMRLDLDIFDVKRIPDSNATTLIEAAHFYLHCELSFAGGGCRWSTGLSSLDRTVNPSHLIAVSDRLKNVELRRMDAFQLINQTSIDPKTFLYVDPPYLHSARLSKDNRCEGESMPRRQYLHELTEQQHIELYGALRDRSCIISGYKSDLYDALYQDWEVRSMRHAGNVEYIWISPAAMNQMSQRSLALEL